MPSKFQAITVSVYAWNTVTQAPQTGDAANLTLRLVRDGGAPAPPTNGPVEIDATNMPGWYQVSLTTSECDANVIVLGGKSSTSGVIVCGAQVTFEQLPTASPGSSGGLVRLGNANNARLVLDRGLTIRDTTTFTPPLFIEGNTDDQVGVVHIRDAALNGHDLALVGLTSSIHLFSSTAPTLRSAILGTGAITSSVLAADTGLRPARSGTAQAGGTATITLDFGASSVDGFYVGLWVYLTGGTGAGQCRVITGYTGSSRVAAVTPAWATAPDATTTFVLLPAGGADLSGLPEATAAAVIAHEIGSGRTVGYYLQGGCNRIEESGGVITVYSHDDTTPLVALNRTRAMVGSLTGIDPVG
jgi:hypothetical protein